MITTNFSTPSRKIFIIVSVAERKTFRFMYALQSKILFFGSKPLGILRRLKTTTNELKCLFTAVACLLLLDYMAVGFTWYRHLLGWSILYFMRIRSLLYTLYIFFCIKKPYSSCSERSVMSRNSQQEVLVIL